ncbi:response regulator transcription factor [Caldalkalibacillus salinus]|uniref:response regulator transcription factor n=1 Tax=Caldalkalibacillus salinus TaxID=2803787 RepID=UPI0019215B2D|nr:response regulator transcription factor [Caldalkalibacillus salinus]
MYKLLIVDDEGLERQALRSMLEQMMDDIEVVGEAENGRKAIELADQLRPDIVTMDIKMPGMDGLEAIEEIQTIEPNVKFIVLSAFDTFSYAQEAMKLKVTHYLLKPYKRDELIKTVGDICGQVDQEREERQEKRDLRDRVGHVQNLAEIEWVSTLIHDQVQDMSLQELNHLLDIKVHYGVGVILHCYTKDQCQMDQGQKQALYRHIKATIKKRTPCLVGPMMGQHLPIFILKEKENLSMSLRSHAVFAIRDLFKAVSKDSTFRTIHVCAGVGRQYDSLEGLKHSYHEALIASRDQFYKANIRFYEDLLQEGDSHGIPFDKEKLFIQAIQKSDEEQALPLFEALFTHILQTQEGQLAQIIRYVTELFVVMTRMNEELGGLTHEMTDFSHVSSIEQLRETALYRLKIIIKRMRDEDEKQSASLLEKAKLYIEEHYNEEMTLDSVSKYINLSPYYFSKIFKEAFQMNFIDYLTHIRIEKAKSLMASSSYSLKEICYEVGYRDPNYFSRVFKKSEGITPSEYRVKQGQS